MEQTKNKKKGIIIGVVVSLLLIVTLGITYAYWQYSNSLGNQTLVAGDIYMKYSETGDEISITNAMPSMGPDETKHFDFTITGRNNYSKPIWYEIVLSHGTNNSGRNTRLEDEFLRFRLVEIKGSDRKVVLDNASYSELEKGQRIWVNTIDAKTDNIEIKYELYMWIAFETRIGNTEGNDYTIDEWNDVYASIKVSVNGDFERKKIQINYPETAQKVLDKANEKQSCNPIVDDDDGTIYFSGDNECIDFNYVWYSGKLWRITSINPDGTMKMITQNGITSIYWGKDKSYKDSWTYQWLNEDFKDTLYNYQNIIVTNANWNATKDENETPVRPPTDSTGTIVRGDVGLLNAYEYYQSYKNLESAKNVYLYIGYTWQLITPNKVGYYYTGKISSSSNGSRDEVRPSIILKSNVELSGNGTKSNPYTIIGDKATGTSGELINTRLSGEYVKVDNKVYRIVGIENGTTKLTSVDYVRDDSGTIIKNKDYLSAWGSNVLTGTDNDWDYYLNNTWLTENLKQYITEGTYYLGIMGVYSDLYRLSYKNSICSESNTSETTKECAKISDTWTGLVGLPRVGEMFATYFGDSESITFIPLITRFEHTITAHIVVTVQPPHLVDFTGSLSGCTTGNCGAVYVRPSINLKSEVKITGGDGMSEKTAYTIGLTS